MPWCELCDLDKSQCVHGLREDLKARSRSATLEISPTNLAHFPGCPHKGDDPDRSGWADLDTPDAWRRLGNGEHLAATGGNRRDRIATGRCRDCVEHGGPWN